MKKMYFIIIGFLVFVNLTILYFYVLKVNEVTVATSNYYKEKEVRKFNEEWIISNQNGDGDSSSFNTTYTKSIFSMYPNNSKVLVFLTSQYNCSSCVENVGEILNDYCNRDLQNNILLVGIAENKRALEVFKRNSETNSHTFAIPSLKTFGYRHSRPCFFILDDKGTIYNYFQPEKSNSKVTFQYLDLFKIFSKS